MLEFVRERLDLFDAAEKTNPFAGGAWTLHFLEQVAEESWTFTIPEYLVGGESLMLLYSDVKSPYRRSAVANYYTSLYSPLISSLESPEERAVAITKLVQQLLKLRPRCSYIDLSPLSDSTETASLQQSISALGWYTKKYECFGNWYLPCANMSFDEYIKGRSSKLLNTWTRKRKKFEQTASSGTRLEIVVDPAKVASAMDAYDAIYAKSWKKPEPYRDFVRNWALVCAQKGWLRLGLAWLGDTPVAAQFWFTMHSRAFIFKLAYDEEHAKLSAGTVLSAHMLKYALDEDRVVEIDYLTGDDTYKTAYMTNRRQRVGLIACDPWTPRGLLVSAKELAGEITKPWRLRLRAHRGAGTSTASPRIHDGERDG